MGVYRDASAQEQALVQDLMKALGLSSLAARSIRSCSTGQLRALLLARALAGEPDLLLLDEPFSGLDVSWRQRFAGWLNDLTQRGIQIVLVTHHPLDILPCIDHTLMLEEGRIVDQR